MASLSTFSCSDNGSPGMPELPVLPNSMGAVTAPLVGYPIELVLKKLSAAAATFVSAPAATWTLAAYKSAVALTDAL